MLRLGGKTPRPQTAPSRNSASLFVREFLQQRRCGGIADIIIHADHSVGITKGIQDGYIDIACIFDNREIGTEIADLIVNEREESLRLGPIEELRSQARFADPDTGRTQQRFDDSPHADAKSVSSTGSYSTVTIFTPGSRGSKPQRSPPFPKD